MHYYDTSMHIGIVQFYFLPEHIHKLEKKRRCETKSYNQKLKRTLRDILLDWAYYKPILVSSLFYPLHFVCMYCVCVCASLSILFIFSSTTALHKHKKGSCSAISAIQATRDYKGFNPFILFYSGLKNKNKLL